AELSTRFPRLKIDHLIKQIGMNPRNRMTSATLSSNNVWYVNCGLSAITYVADWLIRQSLLQSEAVFIQKPCCFCTKIQ
ncbi:hypothetical protein, partial [Pseudoalteromonas sp. PS5]|uniref:hypothetical protein n=1 Tax=Pseudoalteromonas sp. PS5 TaxID=1437473 RepID=UPI0010273105